MSRSTARTSGVESHVSGPARGGPSWQTRWFCAASHAAPRTRTSLSDLSKCQACAPLEVDVIGVDEGAQCSERLAREEIGLGALRKVRLGKQSWGKGSGGADVFKVLEQVGDGLALVLGEDILVQGIAGFAWGLLALGKSPTQRVAANVPPQHEELQMPMAAGEGKPTDPGERGFGDVSGERAGVEKVGIDWVGARGRLVGANRWPVSQRASRVGQSAQQELQTRAQRGSEKHRRTKGATVMPDGWRCCRCRCRWAGRR